jgi:DNA polymerase V
VKVGFSAAAWAAAVINRARTPTTGCIVLALLDGEFTIKRYFHRGHDILLKAENPDHADIVVTEERRFEVWGVIRRSIRTF